jgi:hypothetical protein
LSTEGNCGYNVRARCTRRSCGVMSNADL